jgi:hypothetical protein
MKVDQVVPTGRNRLLAALQPPDLALLAPHLKDLHFEQDIVLQEVCRGQCL